VTLTTAVMVTIPTEMPAGYGFQRRTSAHLERDRRGGVRLQKSSKSGARGAALITALRGKWRSKLPTDEVMRLTRGEP